MWFTIAFFTYPIAFFLTYKACKNYKINGTINLLIAILIFIISIDLLLIELHNLKEIRSELKGIYVSGIDSLFIYDNEFVHKNTLEKRVGKWDLTANDDLYILLTDKQNISNELEISYKDGKPNLVNEKFNFLKLD